RGHDPHRGEPALAGRDERVLRRRRQPGRGLPCPRRGVPPGGPAACGRPRNPPPGAPRMTIHDVLRQQTIELPSWAFGNSGTRFKVFAQQGVPRDPYEKIADAAQVHRYTGVAPTVALHIPWDKVDDYEHLAGHARELGVALGTINSNTFQDNDYMLGSVCHPDARVRQKAVDHLLECVDVMDATGSRDLKLWFADGTNYPGHEELRAPQDRLAESLSTVYERLGPDQRIVLEYKLFEPSFYTMDVPDWGTSLIHCLALRPKAKV